MLQSENPDEGIARERELQRVNDALRAQVADLLARIGELESRANAVVAPSAPAILPRTSPLILPRTSPPMSPAMSPAMSPPTSPPMSPPISAAHMIPRAETRLGVPLEEFIGRRVVPFVGAIAVLAAVGFLVNYAIEIGLIGKLPPLVRFIIGVVVGMGLLAAGEIVRRRGASGAAVGLDAAGVGAVMVSVALGVFSLQIFGPATGAIIAAAAGVLGAMWSVRSGSVTVGVTALLGFFWMLIAVDLAREQPRLAAMLVILALATGLATYLIGGQRFVAVRRLAFVASIALGAVVLGATANPVEAFAFAIIWWGVIAAETTVAALRGMGAVTNLIMLAIASACIALVEVGNWSSAGGSITAIELLPTATGALLFGQFLLLRGFVVKELEDGETSGVEAAMEEPTRAMSHACAMLARGAAALALAMGVGGLAFIVSDAAKGALVVATACVAVWIDRRMRGPAFSIIGVLLGWIGIVAAFVQLALASGVQQVATFSLPFAGARAIELHWNTATMGVAICAMLLIAAISMARLRATAITLSCACVVVWVVLSVAMIPDPFACVMLALPAAVVGWVTRARLSLVLSALVLGGVSALFWLAGSSRALSGSKMNDAAMQAWMLFPCAISAFLLAGHPALARARALLMTVVVCFVGIAVGVVGATASMESQGDALTATLVFVATLASAGGLAMIVGALAKQVRVMDGGMLLSLCAVMLGSLIGLGHLFEVRILGRVVAQVGAQVGAEGRSSASIIAVLLTAVSAAIALRIARGLGDEGRRRAQWCVAIATFSIAPLGGLLLSGALDQPLSPALAVGWVGMVAIVALAVGFRTDRAALRWAGLWSLLLLVARLFFIDLAGAPMLVRIGLLFVSGMVLVGTGIAYAGTSRRSVVSTP